MALADSVPGVSGGTIVYIMGFNDKFITALSNLIHGTGKQRKDALLFLLKLGIGWIIGMGLAVTLLASVFTSGIYQVSSLFFGFVLASIPLIILEEKKAIFGKLKYIPFALLGAAFVIGLSAMNFSAYVQNLGFSAGTALYAVAAGFLAITAMVLPGISGSTLLMTFGLYVPVITGVKELMHLNFTSLWLIACIGIGVILGIVLALRGIKSVLDKHHSASVFTILGMMLGSLYSIVNGPATLKVPQPMMSLSSFHILFFIVGCALVFGLFSLKSWMAHRKGSKTNESVTEL